MPKVLFTKHYPLEIIEPLFHNEYKIETHDFIVTGWIDTAKIKNQIPSNSKNFIVTSLRATKYIHQFRLKGTFFCVGKKSKAFLKKQGYPVALSANDATGLVDELKKSHQEKKEFVYFCSAIRKDSLPHGIRNLGRHCTEIITYKTHANPVKIKNDFDAYVFFSPSGVKSFAEQYAIPKKAVIFAIGNTTGEEVYATLKQEAIIPEIPEFQSLIKTIKAYFDAKK